MLEKNTMVKKEIKLLKRRTTLLGCSCRPGAAMPNTRVENAPSKVRTCEFRVTTLFHLSN